MKEVCQIVAENAISQTRKLYYKDFKIIGGICWGKKRLSYRGVKGRKGEHDQNIPYPHIKLPEKCGLGRNC